MSRKYLALVSGKIQQLLAINSSAGAGDANKIVATGAAGTIDATLLPEGVGADTRSVVASEILAAGDLVNLYDNDGTINARKADNSNSRPAHGYVLDGVAAEASGDVYFSGTISGLTTLTVGAEYYLGTTGAITATAPSAQGTIVQAVGVALSATELRFMRERPILLQEVEA